MPSSDEQTVVARRVRYMNRCRLQLRKRFIEEYLKALEERKRPAGAAQIYVPNGSVVLIKDTLKQKSQWRIGRVEGRITGRDGITRGYKIRTGTGYIVERPVQLISNLGDWRRDQKRRSRSQQQPFEPYCSGIRTQTWSKSRS
eukprot:gene20995-23047_t